MKNGRCRMHGGLSTGPRTPEGLERSRRARWKHGRRSAAARLTRAAGMARFRSIQAEARAFTLRQQLQYRQTLAEVRRVSREISKLLR